MTLQQIFYELCIIPSSEWESRETCTNVLSAPSQTHEPLPSVHPSGTRLPSLPEWTRTNNGRRVATRQVPVGRPPVQRPVTTAVLHGQALLDTRGAGPTSVVGTVVVGPDVSESETGEGEGPPTGEARMDVVKGPCPSATLPLTPAPDSRSPSPDPPSGLSVPLPGHGGSGPALLGVGDLTGSPVSDSLQVKTITTDLDALTVHPPVLDTSRWDDPVLVGPTLTPMRSHQPIHPRPTPSTVTE